jgi:outer membrane protein assembly factor BamD (BamD/ComL family)
MRRILFLAGCAAAAILLSSCQGSPKSIPEGLSAKQLIQRAQEASADGRLETARAYYRAAMERNPDDLAVQCACEYEIAFIDYKQKKYDAAEAGFKALLKRYESPDAAFLPQEYKILSLKIQSKIDAQKKDKAAK